MTDVSNSDDVIDSRDVIARIDELEQELQDILDELEEVEDGEEKDQLQDDLQEWNKENQDELKALQELADEAKGYASDWRHGATLVRETYFEEYCKQLVEDIGDLPRGLPDYLVIDWDATADNLRADYTDVDFDGVTYLVR